jgi:TolB-like protein/Tfp pilus assembly protein PilF
VFPFRNVSGDPEEEFYALGLTEVLSSNLGKIRAFQVVAPTAVMQFQDQDAPLSEIAAALRAAIIVEGSVLRSGGQVRVTAALIDPVTESQLWSDNYERPEEDILVLQGEVARAIANEIRIELTPQEEARLASARPVDPQAQEAYLKGRYSLLTMTEQGVLKSVEYFEASIAHDSDYAMAHAGLADAYVMLGTVGASHMPAKEAMPKAKAAALKALELDEMLAEAHLSLAQVYSWFDWDFERAEQEFLRAIELNPSLGTARARYAFLLSLLERHDEAIAQAHIGAELDPLNLWLQLHEGACYLFARRYDEAYDRYAGVLELDPNLWVAHWSLGIIDTVRGNLDEAIASLEHARDLAGPNPGVLGSLGKAYGLAGRRAEAEAILKEVKQLSAVRHVPPDTFAHIHIGLGDLDAAFDALEQGYLERSGSLLTSLPDCFTKPMHGDPRCIDLRQRVGLPLAAPAVD